MFDFPRFKNEVLDRLKQSDIAIKLGKSQPAVSQMLARLENLKVKDLDAICEIAEVDPKEFYASELTAPPGQGDLR